MTLKNLLGLGLTALKSNFTTLDKPYKVNYCITYLCQSRCLTCNIWQMRPKGELTIDEVREFAKKNNSFKWVELTGGEPFLREDIDEIARAFKENCKSLYILTVPTNSLVNHDKVVAKLENILKLGIPRVAVTVSLDGYRELHDKIRGIPGNYDKAIDMFKRLKELKRTHKNLFFVFGYTLSRFNQGQFEKTFELVKKDIPDLKRNDFHINLAQLSSNYYGNETLDIKPNDPVVVEELATIRKKRDMQLAIIPIIENAYMKRLVLYAKTGKQPMRSRSLEASAFIDSYGNVYPSIMWDRKLANLREISYDLSSIWQSDAAHEVRKMAKDGTEPAQWTSCEAYQTLVGDVFSLIK
jgi:MoaA/NifB/PqqE/SkfB family radical SAM enzyme